MTTRRPSVFLTSRALGLGLVAVLLMAGMVILGLWQLGVYDDHQHDDARSQLSRPAAPLTGVLGPDEAFPADAVSRPVTVAGQYLPDQQFELHGSHRLSADRLVVTPLQVDGGSAVLVVRGTGDRTTSPPRGAVQITGVLEPSDVAGSGLHSGRATGGLRVAALVQDLPGDLYSGYVILSASDPADPLTPVAAPLPDASRWAGARNLVYAVQWWLFAAFVAFMWWRIVTDTADPEVDTGTNTGSNTRSNTGTGLPTHQSTDPAPRPPGGRPGETAENAPGSVG